MAARSEVRGAGRMEQGRGRAGRGKESGAAFPDRRFRGGRGGVRTSPIPSTIGFRIEILAIPFLDRAGPRAGMRRGRGVRLRRLRGGLFQGEHQGRLMGGRGTRAARRPQEAGEADDRAGAHEPQGGRVRDGRIRRRQDEAAARHDGASAQEVREGGGSHGERVSDKAGGRSSRVRPQGRERRAAIYAPPAMSGSFFGLEISRRYPNLTRNGEFRAFLGLIAVQNRRSGILWAYRNIIDTSPISTKRAYRPASRVSISWSASMRSVSSGRFACGCEACR